ncbi:MAG: serine/threonine protein kinase [Acidobacteriia bacterium]|nr:serine/threonine protein kinase [Terriglobia bacterium]
MNDQGQLIAGRYRLLSLLGEGAYSSAHLAQDTALSRQVIIKIATQLDETGAAKLQKEAAALSRIRHPRVAQILDSGRLDDGRCYLVLDWIEGDPLDKILVRGTLTLPQALTLLRAITEALAAAHAVGIIHRDIKPSNVIVPAGTDGPAFSEACLVDFGALGELMRPSGGQALTQTGQFYGTPTYMSPEQLRAQPQSAATDVYGLGVLLYEMLIGYPPFNPKTQDTFAFLVKIMNEEVSIPAEKHIPTEVSLFLIRCLSKNPSKRPQSAAEVLREIEGLLQTSGIPPVDIEPPREGRPGTSETSSRNWPGVLLVIGILIGALGAVVLGWMNRGKLSAGYGILAGLLIGLGGLALSFFVRKSLEQRRPEVERQATRVLLGTKVRNILSASLALDVEDLISKCRRIDEKILGETIVKMVREYESAKESKDKQSALMNVAQLLEKLMPRLSPWYIRHEKLIAFLISFVGIVSGLVTAAVSLAKIIKAP